MATCIKLDKFPSSFPFWGRVSRGQSYGVSVERFVCKDQRQGAKGEWDQVSVSVVLGSICGQDLNMFA